MYCSAFILWYDHFLDSGQKFVKFFVVFLENSRHQKDILKLTDLLMWHTFRRTYLADGNPCLDAVAIHMALASSIPGVVFACSNQFSNCFFIKGLVLHVQLGNYLDSYAVNICQNDVLSFSWLDIVYNSIFWQSAIRYMKVKRTRILKRNFGKDLVNFCK